MPSNQTSQPTNAPSVHTKTPGEKSSRRIVTIAYDIVMSGAAILFLLVIAAASIAVACIALHGILWAVRKALLALGA